MPDLELPPDLVLVAFLPPLLYAAAFFTSLRELRANVRPIGLLSIGLVLMTTVVVAIVAHAAIDELSWPTAFVLGAIVSPTDPLAATTIARRLGVPRRLVTIVEGESLINDGTALVAYRVAVAAAVSGSFSLWDAGMGFVLNAVGGIAIGLAVGWVVRQVRRRLDNPPAEIAISLLTGYFAFLPAERLGVSAVLAAVSAGVYLGWHAPELTTVQVRLQGFAVWEILVLVLNALLFVLIGLQLPAILDALGNYSTATLVGYGALVSATVILARFVWVFTATYLPRLGGGRGPKRDSLPWQGPAMVAWTGMRGAVSLAAALALPLETDAGSPFPGRELIIFLAFSVILATLVAQGLSLPLVIRWLGLEDDGLDASEEAKARKHAALAALARLDELIEEDWVREDTAERLRGAYRFRLDRFAARFDEDDDGNLDERSAAFQRLRRELLEAERLAVVDLRRQGHITDDVMHRVERDLDLEDARLEI
jgi:CPA1 family monovalent cation:H+ antiporter